MENAKNIRHVYADNAATTAMSTAALEKMIWALESQYGNPSSLHTVGQEAKVYLEDARARVAKCLGAADPREIIFTSGGSESDNTAVRSAAYNGAKKGRKHLISTAFEHHAILHTLDALKKEGFEVTLLPVSPDGFVTAEQVRDAIRPDTALVSVMYANNEIGTVQPIREIGAVCRAAGVKERIGCHTTRKTFGYHFYKQYHDLVKLQRILGHSSTRDTLVYIGMIDDEVDESLRHFKLLGE